jgi:hypothetical protein
MRVSICLGGVIAGDWIMVFFNKETRKEKQFPSKMQKINKNSMSMEIVTNFEAAK